MPENAVQFDEFLDSWKESIRDGSPSTVELGRRFSLKLITQWLDTSESGIEWIYCDGARDGGIDLAVLDVGAGEEGDANPGHTWFLIQSKYGTAFQGPSTLLLEGQKVIETLDGRRAKLNSLAEGLQERLSLFKSSAGSNDKIILTFATERPLNDAEQRALKDIRTIGRERLGGFFDVETISVETIFSRLGDEIGSDSKRLTLSLRAQAVPSGGELLVGSTKLIDLYRFLVTYREKTGDLDQVYEKNVRRFLGGRGKVNKGMQETLKNTPSHFGLYNNGITIVASDWQQTGDEISLTDPYIVNGCQTSRTIWEVFHQRHSSGGTGVNPEIEDWKHRAAEGAVVTKIVKVGADGEKLLQKITRYTNSQNAVRDKDFLALADDFRMWHDEMASHYGIYLEIQRGGWDSQKALQNANGSVTQFTSHVNAGDLIKVFGAGWLCEVGMAFGKNPPFLPDGSVFKRIVSPPEDGQSPFGVTELYSCFLLHNEADKQGFGRGAKKSTRALSRFLFYMVIIDLVKDVLNNVQSPTDNRSVAVAVAKIFQQDESRSMLVDSAVTLIDRYFTQDSEESIFKEPSFQNEANGNLNAFLKAEVFGRNLDHTPKLKEALSIEKRYMRRAYRDDVSASSVIESALN